MLDKLAAPLLAAGGDLLGGLFGSSSAKSRQEDAQAFSADQFSRRYQITTADMKAAGLNPMLAYSQGPGTSPSSSAASASSFGNPGSAGVAAFNAATQAQMSSAQIDNLTAQTRKTNAEADVAEATGMERARAEINNILSSTGVNLETQGKLVAETEKLGQELLNLKSQRDQIEAIIKNLKEQNTLLQRQGLTEIQRANYLNANARLIGNQARMVGFDINAVVKSGEVGRLAREVKPVSDIASDWLSPGKWIDKVLPDKWKRVR
jgi:hypothetical protein